MNGYIFIRLINSVQWVSQSNQEHVCIYKTFISFCEGDGAAALITSMTSLRVKKRQYSKDKPWQNLPMDFNFLSFPLLSNNKLSTRLKKSHCTMTLLFKLKQTVGIVMTPCQRSMWAVNWDKQVLYMCNSMSQTIPHHSRLWSVWCFYKATVATLKHRLSMPAVRKNLTIQKRKSITKITLAVPEASDKVWKTEWDMDDLSLHYADVWLCVGALVKAAHSPPPTHPPKMTAPK